MIHRLKIGRCLQNFDKREEQKLVQHQNITTVFTRAFANVDGRTQKLFVFWFCKFAYFQEIHSEYT